MNEMTQETDKTRRFRQVAAQLEELIERGQWAVGARLPGEREMIKRFAVSRTVFREALILLELKGVVEIRVGSGTYIRPKNMTDGGLPGSGLMESAKPFDLIFARRLVESEVARLAALTATPDDLKKMRIALKQMETDAEPFMHRHISDKAFHLAIAEATRNPALMFVVAAYWDAYRKCIVDGASSIARRPENRERALADHSAIYFCIEAKDGAGAAAAMQAHLDRVSRFLSSFSTTGNGFRPRT
jgi:DNA-binding FadR family transcriptional regulator